MEEQILAEGCRKGDDMARKELYDRYAGRLLSICMRYAGDCATAEDLLHDAFLKIYGAFDRFTYRGTGSLRAWIERITVNVALEWIRSRSKLGSVTLDEGKAAAEVAEGADAVHRRAARGLPGGVQPLLHRGVFPPRHRPDAGNQREKLLFAVVSRPGHAGPQDQGLFGDALKSRGCSSGISEKGGSSGAAGLT